LKSEIVSYRKYYNFIWRGAKKKKNHNMNFLKLFLVALAPVMNTLIIAVIGAILALDNIGILRKKYQEASQYCKSN
jgi:hypothetical protein